MVSNWKMNIGPALTMSFLLISCSSSEKSKENNTTSSSTTTTSENDTELADKPSYAVGSCEGEYGCIQGFISHGMRITLTPDSAGTDKDATDGDMVLETYEFKDAQDFGDRFDTAFLKPLVPEDKLDQYSFKISPLVKRDNFAAGFELYSEGAEANDDLVTMEGEGNFNLGTIAPFDAVALRVVKTFRIEIEKKVDAEDETPIITRAITCLEVVANLENLEVNAGEITKVGGIRNFNFYYTEDDSLCQESKVGEAQSRDISATQLPSTSADIP